MYLKFASSQMTHSVKSMNFHITQILRNRTMIQPYWLWIGLFFFTTNTHLKFDTKRFKTCLCGCVVVEVVTSPLDLADQSLSAGRTQRVPESQEITLR